MIIFINVILFRSIENSMSTLWIIPDENGVSVFFYHKLKIYLDYVY